MEARLRPLFRRSEAPNAAGNQQEGEPDDPRPRCDGIAHPEHAEVGEKREEEQDQGNHPDDRRRGLAGGAEAAHEGLLSSANSRILAPSMTGPYFATLVRMGQACAAGNTRPADLATSFTPSAPQTRLMVAKRGWASGRSAL